MRTFLILSVKSNFAGAISAWAQVVDHLPTSACRRTTCETSLRTAATCNDPSSLGFTRRTIDLVMTGSTILTIFTWLSDASRCTADGVSMALIFRSMIMSIMVSNESSSNTTFKLNPYRATTSSTELPDLRGHLWIAKGYLFRSDNFTIRPEGGQSGGATKQSSSRAKTVDAPLLSRFPSRIARFKRPASIHSSTAPLAPSKILICMSGSHCLADDSSSATKARATPDDIPIATSPQSGLDFLVIACSARLT